MSNLLQHEPPFFERSDQLNRDSTTSLAIRHGVQDTANGWDGCLARDLEPKTIDSIYPYLWLVARKEGAHIDSLHEQVIKKRVIIVSENPGLHLVWFYDTVYIKPLPDYLLSFEIWKNYIPKSPFQPVHSRPRYDKYRAALGFLRSYSLLIQHESDYFIAQKANLLPKYVSFQRFQKFIWRFRFLIDDEVSCRYHYGQLRLTRLNWAVRTIRIICIISPGHTRQQLPWSYQKEFWQTSQYLRHYAGPLIFIFAVLTLVLSSMQVILAALGNNTWEAFVRFSWGFSLATIIFSIIPILGPVIGVFALLIVQGRFALRMRRKELRAANNSG
ncbi:hypothetical protein F5Y10DRAFT_244464 [Nemania abortiva]|nr:hypothetical protein F5Y10DRAFT_244464 [Nemania abortiva]